MRQHCPESFYLSVNICKCAASSCQMLRELTALQFLQIVGLSKSAPTFNRLQQSVSVINTINMSEFCPIAVSSENMAQDQPKTASEALLSFVKKKRLCDVIFTFENSPQRIEAHQLCLRSRSPVFDSMFRGRGSVSETVELKVEDVKPHVFHKFIEFIYTDKLEVTPVEALHLQHLGQKYKVQPLIEKCETIVLEEIPVESAVEMYETAHKYGILGVKKKAEDLIVRSLERLLQDPQLLSAKESTLLEILTRDDLRVREVDLFEFVLRWGHATAADHDNLPQVLAPLIPKLRFTNMTPEEFTTIVMPTKLIPPDEALEIYAYFNGDQSTRTALLSKFKERSFCRCGKLNETLDFYEAESVDKGVGHPKPLWNEGKYPLRECISFSVHGITGMDDTNCPRFTRHKSRSKLLLKSIKGQWPSLCSREVDDKLLVHIFILEKKSGGEEFKETFYTSVEDYKVGCVTEILIDPPVEICNGAEYVIAVYDGLWYERPYAATHRYRVAKNIIMAGCLKNVEIWNVRRNECPTAVVWDTGYEDIYVIRGMHLELDHNNTPN